MGTPALIAHKIEGEYVCITVNFDGHTDSVGKTLREVFNTNERVVDLLALGDCSSIALAKDITEVVAYHRDRNEPWKNVRSMNFDTLDEAQALYSPIFTYVWDGEKWTGYYKDDELDW